jgi:hypothetical protein
LPGGVQASKRKFAMNTRGEVVGVVRPLVQLQEQ